MVLFQRDLAARNILLTHDMKAKVADFGLSTRIYSQTGARLGCKKDIVPFRWAAYEELKNGTSIREFSDVWSFGVLMWEIFYLGSAIPYGSSKGVPEIKTFLQNGQRLEKPPLCPKFVYDLMQECWQENYLYRPTFNHLKSQLKKFDPKKEELLQNQLTSCEDPNLYATMQ